MAWARQEVTAKASRSTKDAKVTHREGFAVTKAAKKSSGFVFIVEARGDLRD
jgi:hypothetical protein